MDRERARFVLRCFRPDGADVGDEDFKEALRLATSDRELGEWLVRERAFDAEFAECLARVDLPEGLRANVLLAMVQGGSGLPKTELEDDRIISSAMAAVKVPEGLRERILVAMEHTSIEEIKPKSWIRFGVPLAAAAGIVMGFILLGSENLKPSGLVETQQRRISVDAVQVGFVKTYESPVFKLDATGKDPHSLISHLKSKGLPCGDMKFPPGLESLEGLGCCELKLGGKRGSIICFEDKNGPVHLIIFLRKDIEGALPDMSHPVITQSDNWSKASWGNEKYAFALMAIRDKEQMGEFF